ncbi:MAG: hypothetical protein ACJ72N_12675 [Labedaea sp.]
MRARRVAPPHHAVTGWLLAMSSTGLAVTAHGVAGGGLPDTALLLPLTALIAWGAGALAGRLRGVLPLLGALAVVQLGLHLLLSQGGYAHAGHPPGPGPASGVAMLAGHALAILLTAVLLSRAAAGLAAVSSAIARLFGRLRAPRLPLAGAAVAIGRTRAAPARPGVLLEIQLRRVRARRGPPVRS